MIRAFIIFGICVMFLGVYVGGHELPTRPQDAYANMWGVVMFSGFATAAIEWSIKALEQYMRRDEADET